MIYYNSNTINDWNFGDDNIIKVYRNNAVCYYKISGGGDTPTAQTPCYAVVDDISQYSDTEFEDVFNKADEKWYKLNNLNQYEEYGIYGSGRNVTTYDGKLTIDDEASSRLPQGYTEVEYVENTGTSYINTNIQIYSSTTDSFEIESKLIAAKHDSQTYQNVFSCMSEDGEPYQGFTYRYQSSSLVGTSIPNGQNTFTIVNNEDSTQTVTVTSSSSQRTYTHTYPLTLFCGLNSSKSPFRWTNSKFYYFKVKMNDELVRDLVPCKRDSDDKYGMYDIVNDTFYTSPNNVDFSGGEQVIEPTKTYEYEWNGSSWVNVGEVSGSSRLPQGYTEVEYVENTSSAYINTGVYLYDSTTNSYTIQCKHYFQPYGSDFEYLFSTEGTSSPYVGVNFRYYQRNLQYNSSPSNVTWTHINNGDGTSGITASCSSTNATNGNNPLTLFCGLWSTGPWRFGRGKIYSFTVTKNNSIVRDLVPCKRDSDSMVGMYDLVNDEFYYPPNYSSYQLVAGAETGTTTYPLYYDEIQDPPNNVTFTSMTEAEAYECPWVGMNATIAGDNYIFSGDSISGYEWVESVDFQKQYLTFVATESGTFKFSGNSINYSLDDGVTWTTLASNTNSPTVSAGNKILWKATLTPSSNGIGRFYSSGLFVVEGNVMSLLFGDNFSEQTSLVGKDYAFNSLFSGCTNVTSAENLSLPATTLSTSCYQYLFLDCSNISVVPSVLLATTLADNCYNGMFGNCTSLTTAPKMLATTLVNRCCQYMYINCSSLNSVTCLATNPSTSYTTSWLSGVAASGTFYKSPNATWTSGSSGIPSNWTVLDYSS